MEPPASCDDHRSGADTTRGDCLTRTRRRRPPPVWRDGYVVLRLGVHRFLRLFCVSIAARLGRGSDGSRNENAARVSSGVRVQKSE